MENKIEWISVEERLPENTDAVLVLIRDDEPSVGVLHYVDGLWRQDKYSSVGEFFITHWMPLPEPPKPKVPTFRDVFLRSCPHAKLDDDGLPVVCRCDVYPYVETDTCHGEDGENCGWCWNQPYYEEEEGETE